MSRVYSRTSCRICTVEITTSGLGNISHMQTHVRQGLATVREERGRKVFTPIPDAQKIFLERYSKGEIKSKGVIETVPPELSIVGKDLTNRYVVIRADCVGKKYRDLRYRLLRAEGGFGCNPALRGTAVTGTTPYDGEEARWDRGEILRFATPEEVSSVVGGDLGTTA